MKTPQKMNLSVFQHRSNYSAGRTGSMSFLTDQKMTPAVVISCLLVATIFQTGQLAEVETVKTVWAAVGDQASLSCRLTEDKDVLQITWQKVLPDGENTLATYIKDIGSRVSSGLEEKMDFQYESLQSCSMVIRKVMEEDEGCYRCLFNTYPNGALIGRTCLKLDELLGPDSAAPRERLVTVPNHRETFGGGLDVEFGSDYRIVGQSVITGFVFLVCVFVAALICVRLRKKAEKRENDNASDTNSHVMEPLVPEIIEPPYNVRGVRTNQIVSCHVRKRPINETGDMEPPGPEINYIPKRLKGGESSVCQIHVENPTAEMETSSHK